MSVETPVSKEPKDEYLGLCSSCRHNKECAQFNVVKCAEYIEVNGVVRW